MLFFHLTFISIKWNNKTFNEGVISRGIFGILGEGLGLRKEFKDASMGSLFLG